MWGREGVRDQCRPDKCWQQLYLELCVDWETPGGNRYCQFCGVLKLGTHNLRLHMHLLCFEHHSYCTKNSGGSSAQLVAIYCVGLFPGR
jgi:hypothetical protein